MSAKISDLDDASALTGVELFELVQSGGVLPNKKGSAAFLKAYFQTPAAGANVVFCGLWDLSSNTVPTTGGTGSAGVIRQGNLFYISDGVDEGTPGFPTGPDGGPVIAGWFAFAAANTPGTDLSDKTKWILIPTIF